MIALLVLFTLGVVYGQSQTWSLQLLTSSLANGAACLDGSPPAYYLRPGFGDGVNKWLLFHEGGGWCTSLNDCLARSKTTLGSSKTYPDTWTNNDGYFSPDTTVNPLMYNWNMVYFKYCDGASFSGNNDSVSVVDGTKLYWRGLINLRAYVDDLNANHGLQKGTDFVISGCSAGGLATYLHSDWWGLQIPRTSRIRGMPDSGYFLDYDSAGTVKYGTSMRWVFQQQNCSSGVNQRCIAANLNADPSDCFFAEHTTPHLITPIFPLQSRFDSWQIDNILGSRDATAVNTYGTLFTKRFQAVVANPVNGYFEDSCYHHCGEWDQIKIDGMVSGPAFTQWYNTGKGGYFQQQNYPCAACCVPGK